VNVSNPNFCYNIINIFNHFKGKNFKCMAWVNTNTLGLCRTCSHYILCQQKKIHYLDIQWNAWNIYNCCKWCIHEIRSHRCQSSFKEFILHVAIMYWFIKCHKYILNELKIDWNSKYDPFSISPYMFPYQ
jgi:hypothetical protein